MTWARDDLRPQRQTVLVCSIAPSLEGAFARSVAAVRSGTRRSSKGRVHQRLGYSPQGVFGVFLVQLFSHPCSLTSDGRILTAGVCVV